MKDYIVYNEKDEMEDILLLSDEQCVDFLEKNPEWTLEPVTIDEPIFEDTEDDSSDEIEEEEF